MGSGPFKIIWSEELSAHSIVEDDAGIAWSKSRVQCERIVAALRADPDKLNEALRKVLPFRQLVRRWEHRPMCPVAEGVRDGECTCPEYPLVKAVVELADELVIQAQRGETTPAAWFVSYYNQGMKDDKLVFLPNHRIVKQHPLVWWASCLYAGSNMILASWQPLTGAELALNTQVIVED